MVDIVAVQITLAQHFVASVCENLITFYLDFSALPRSKKKERSPRISNQNGASHGSLSLALRFTCFLMQRFQRRTCMLRVFRDGFFFLFFHIRLLNSEAKQRKRFNDSATISFPFRFYFPWPPQFSHAPASQV